MKKVSEFLQIAVPYILGGAIMFAICDYELSEQKRINEALYEANEELKTNYDILEIQYKRDLEDCYTQFGDYQDKVEAGCFVNGGWNCE